jgi:hypothetical protein
LSVAAYAASRVTVDTFAALVSAAIVGDVAVDSLTAALAVGLMGSTDSGVAALIDSDGAALTDSIVDRLTDSVVVAVNVAALNARNVLSAANSVAAKYHLSFA